MKAEKIMDIVYRGFFFSYMVLIAFMFVCELKNPDQFNSSINQIITQKEETSMLLKLYVVDKRIHPSGMVGIPNQYELILSSEIFSLGKSVASSESLPDFLIVGNELSVSVTREEFKKYEINESYEFELVEKTTISSSRFLRLPSLS